MKFSRRTAGLASGLLTVVISGTAWGNGAITNAPASDQSDGKLVDYVGPSEFTASEHFARHLHLPPTVKEDFWSWQRGAIIPLALLGAGAGVWASGADKSIQHYFKNHPLGLGSTDDIGMYTLVSLGAVHAAGLSWISPEAQNGWREIEVYGETEGATALLTDGILKPGVGRHRPDSSRNDSFPSGHAATAFASATYISRYWMRQYDDGMCPLVVPVVASTVSYGTATAVGLTRLDNNSHWASDVLIGAGIGMLLGQALYALHFDERGVFRHPNWQLHTFDDGPASGLALTYRF